MPFAHDAFSPHFLNKYSHQTPQKYSNDSLSPQSVTLKTRITKTLLRLIDRKMEAIDFRNNSFFPVNSGTFVYAQN